MRILKFFLSLLATAALIGLCSWHHPFGLGLPPVGDFFNPFRGFWQNAEPVAELPTLGTHTLTGLSAPVDIVFDERMVPHVFAANDADAAYAQGYLAARFRLWQMDISARATGGRLAEVLGEAMLERDRIQRRKGIVWAAENTVKGWERSDEIDIINAYTAGINDWIAQLSPADYPLEYKILNYAPEPWTPLKSAIFVKAMAESLCARQTDWEAANTRQLVGNELFDFLFPDWFPAQSPIIPMGTEWGFEPQAAQPAPDSAAAISLAAPSKRLFDNPPVGNGSNNWAVSGSRTASGHPILCNDPHLNLTLPAIWYEMQIHTPNLNAYGVSLPGLPGIVIGFNEHIAWGQTNVGHDVMDWYSITWADKGKTQYLLDGSPRPVQVREEAIAVRGRDALVTERVPYTVWGPVVYEAEGDQLRDMAMRWVSHDGPSEDYPTSDVGAFWKLMCAKNHAEYIEALATYDSPAQNFVFAARDGDIAIKINGKLPIKSPGQGRFVQDGSSSASAWAGFVPREHLPHMRNPARGYVSSANQHSTAPDYPYYYNGGFDQYRGRLINSILDTLQNVTLKEMAALQNNVQSLKAIEGLAALMALTEGAPLSGLAKQIRDDLSRWDGRYEKDLKTPVAFDRWYQEAFRQTFDELYAANEAKEVILPENWRFLWLMNNAPQHDIFDVQATPEKENAADLALAALLKVAEEMAIDYGDAAFNLAKAKAAVIPHLGRIPGFDMPLMLGGDGNAPNAIKKSHGPSWRMMVEMGDYPTAMGIYPGGQSGNPGSPYYDNFVADWSRGEYQPLILMKNAADPAAKVLFKEKLLNK